jgi:hypothetical protein
MLTTEQALDRALNGVLCDIGQIDKLTKGKLNRAVRAGKLQKWRGRWCPEPGAPWGIGPLKTCYGVENPYRDAG